MERIILAVCLLVSSVVSAQPPGYTKINSRYKWIAGAFDSTLTIPSGPTASLRTLGYNAPGGLFYQTSDSTLYTYTGTQWIPNSGGSYTFVNGLTESAGTVKFGGTQIDAITTYQINKNRFQLDNATRTYFEINGADGDNALEISIDDESTGTGERESTLNLVAGSNKGSYFEIGSRRETGVRQIGINGSADDATLEIYSDYDDIGKGSKIEVNYNNIILRPDSGTIIIDTLSEAANMTNKTVMVWDTDNGRWERINKDSVGGTGVNIYNSDGTLTGNRTIDADGNSFEISAIDDLLFEANHVLSTIPSGSNNYILLDGNARSQIYLFTDSIKINPYQGNLKIDTLNNETSQNKLMGWVETTGADRGKVGYVTIGSGLSLSSGVLSASGGSSGITVGTTTITSGTSGRIAYNNAGVYGEKAVTGTGDVVLATSPTLVTPDLGTPSTLVGTNISGTISTRWKARVGSTTSSATPTINTDNVDIYKLTAQAADITSFTTNLSGTPNDGDILEIQITGTAARAITWGASFVSTTVTLPATTVTTATLTVILQYYTTSSYGNNTWHCVNYY